MAYTVPCASILIHFSLWHAEYTHENY